MEEKKSGGVKMRDFNKVDRFRTFLYENYDKCFMKDIEYSLNGGSYQQMEGMFKVKIYH